ncbi:hypothetical protein EXE43_26235 [Halorubrum sp. SS5]|nr:hypothetical protein EXE43_26235 [Halorubrum sp. SS5]
MDTRLDLRVEIENHHKSETLRIRHSKPIPRRGETVTLKGDVYRVTDVTHDYGAALPEDLDEPTIRLDVVAVADDVTRDVDP